MLKQVKLTAIVALKTLNEGQRVGVTMETNLDLKWIIQLYISL